MFRADDDITVPLEVYVFSYRKLWGKYSGHQLLKNFNFVGSKQINKLFFPNYCFAYQIPTTIHELWYHKIIHILELRVVHYFLWLVVRPCFWRLRNCPNYLTLANTNILSAGTRFIDVTNTGPVSAESLTSGSPFEPLVTSQWRECWVS